MSLIVKQQQERPLKKTVQYKRTSGLKAPIILMTGHSAPVLSTKFSPDGQHLATSDSKGSIDLWETYNENKNIGVLDAGKQVSSLSWSYDLFAAVGDNVQQWNTTTGERIKQFKGHSSLVNCVAATNRLFASVSDDGYALVWDQNEKDPIVSINQEYPLLSCDWSIDGITLFTAGIEGTVYAWDIRNTQLPLFTLKGHNDAICSIKANGNNLVSNSFDNTIKLWDIRPFAPSDRHVAQFQGAPHSFEKTLNQVTFSRDGEFIISGAGDRTVTIFEIKSQRIVYKLPGHKGPVTAVDWHPLEDVIVSGSLDTQVFLGELNLELVRNR